MKIIFDDGILACMSRDFHAKCMKTPRGILPAEQLRINTDREGNVCLQI